MRFSARFAVVVLIIAVGMSMFSLSATGPVMAQGHKRYILLGENNVLPANLEGLVAAAGGQVVGSIDEIGVAIAESSEPSFVEAVEGISGVQGVAEDRTVLLAPPDDSPAVMESEDEAVVMEGHNPAHAKFFFAQWNMRAIGADKAWAAGFKGSSAVKVAVIDTGVDYTHQELSGKVDLVKSKSFFSEPLSPLPPGLPAKFEPKPFTDFNGHGTHVAAIIAGHGISVAGVAPHITIIAVKVAGKGGFADFSTVVEAIVYAANAGADIGNMSFGAQLEKAGRESAQLMAALNRAVNYAHARGVLLVASSGNSAINWDSRICEETLPDGTTTFVNCPAGKLPSNMTLLNMMKLPAQLPHVLAVSATGPLFGKNFDAAAVRLLKSGSYAEYSDFGNSIVTFAAPGGSGTPPMTDRVISACSRFIEKLEGNPNTFPCRSGRVNTFKVGTSMAAAHVSGVAALVDSAAGGALLADEIMAVLKQFSDDLGKPGKDEQYGFGRINAYRAVTRK